MSGAACASSHLAKYWDAIFRRGRSARWQSGFARLIQKGASVILRLDVGIGPQERDASEPVFCIARPKLLLLDTDVLPQECKVFVSPQFFFVEPDY
jgi:hypothetical protein